MAIATAQDKENIKHLSDNFYTFSQEIIETFYLKPLSTTGDKQNLKDAAIERPIHGGMHVGRAQFYPIIIHNLMQKNFPELTKNNINILTETLGLTEQEILLLTRYAILFHDSARQGEGQDIWDDSSAKNCHDFLITQGISKPIAVIFSEAAACKDKPDDYTKQLSNIIPNITEAQIQSLQYIRKLIYLADCLDIMRCVDSFKLTEIYKAFTDIPEKEHQQFFNNDLLELVKNIHALINKQKDMLCDCKVLQNNEVEFETITSVGVYDLREKVKYEHANNVCSAIGASMIEEGYFAQYLEQEAFTDTTKALVTPQFNPFIHGTTSLALPILEKTNLALMSPIDMLEKFNLAPFGGEITGGGLDALDARCYTCFGRLKSESDSKGYNYTLDKIISNYTNASQKAQPDADKIYVLIKDELKEGLNASFSNINYLLIYIARAQQLGIKPMTQNNFERLIQYIKANIQFFYLVLLLGNHIHPNYYYLKQLSEEQIHTFASAVQFHLTYIKIVEKIIGTDIDIEYIYNNPTKENLPKILKLLELPNQILGLDVGFGVKKDVDLPATQIFTAEKTTNYPHDKAYNNEFNDLEYRFMAFAKNKYLYNIAAVLEDLTRGKISQNALLSLTNMLQNYPLIFKEKLKILQNLHVNNTMILNDSYMKIANVFIYNPFPIIFVCENEDKIRLADFSTQEYRSNNTSLKIGSDIKMIATNSRENRLLLMKFLEENGINNVQVVLFDQLKESKRSGQPPKSPHIHKDGAPTLAWLAAKTISKQPKLLEQFESKMLTMKDKLDPTSMIELVDDANKLDNIRLTP